MRVLALDFDGVISDSAREAFAVALRTHAALEPGSPFAGREEDAALYARFLELMPLGNRAEDYGVCLEAIRGGVALPDQAAYDRFHAGRDADWLRRFHERFYRERAAWAEADPTGWRARMRAYPGVPAMLRRHAREVALAIATSKDRRSVRALLEGYGIADLFPEERVLDKETGVHKRAHVGRLVQALEVPFQEITFVDDKVNHLRDVAPLGARCVLAAWGYNGERERREAREAGFLVCGLEDAERVLFG